MKIKLLLAFLFVAQLGTAQNITFPDPAFKDLLLISYINYTGDPNNYVAYPNTNHSLIPSQQTKDFPISKVQHSIVSSVITRTLF